MMMISVDAPDSPAKVSGSSHAVQRGPVAGHAKQLNERVGHTASFTIAERKEERTVAVYHHGDRYEGEWKIVQNDPYLGEKHGMGLLCSPNGDRYEGNFKD